MFQRLLDLFFFFPTVLKAMLFISQLPFSPELFLSCFCHLPPPRVCVFYIQIQIRSQIPIRSIVLEKATFRPKPSQAPLQLTSSPLLQPNPNRPTPNKHSTPANRRGGWSGPSGVNKEPGSVEVYSGSAKSRGHPEMLLYLFHGLYQFYWL